MSLVVTGTVSTDSVYLPTGHAERVLGGSGSYFCAAAAQFGPVRFVAAVGDDFEQKNLDVIRSIPNLDSAGLEVRKGSKTLFWAAKYSEDMNSRETLTTELGVLLEALPPVPQTYRDSRYVFLANMNPASQLELLHQFPNRVLAVADTMDLWINVARPDLDKLLQAVDGLVLNFDEAEQLTSTKNSVAAAKKLLDMGPRFVVVKKGEHGCLIACKDHGAVTLAAMPAYPTEKVIDPTGAGDSFAGGFMGYLASRKESASARGDRMPLSMPTLRQALAYGTVAASFTIEDFSLNRLRTVTRKEIDARYQEYAEMVRV
jgi:sugar/nucleoside kinase (ribokinase family)